MSDELTETLLRAAGRMDEDAQRRTRRDHDARLLGTLADAMRDSAAEHVPAADGTCAGCPAETWPCPPARRWLAIANIALEERPQSR